MCEENLLLLIDYLKLFNLKYINLCFLDLFFDFGNKYFIFYFWGIVGIVYNFDMIYGKKIKSWNDLWDFKLKN